MRQSSKWDLSIRFIQENFFVRITILPRACYIPSLPFYTIVDVKLYVILFYSNASTTRSVIIVYLEEFIPK